MATNDIRPPERTRKDMNASRALRNLLNREQPLTGGARWSIEPETGTVHSHFCDDPREYNLVIAFSSTLFLTWFYDPVYKTMRVDIAPSVAAIEDIYRGTR